MEEQGGEKELQIEEHGKRYQCEQFVDLVVERQRSSWMAFIYSEKCEMVQTGIGDLRMEV